VPPLHTRAVAGLGAHANSNNEGQSCLARHAPPHTTPHPLPPHHHETTAAITAFNRCQYCIQTDNRRPLSRLCPWILPRRLSVGHVSRAAGTSGRQGRTGAASYLRHFCLLCTGQGLPAMTASTCRLHRAQQKTPQAPPPAQRRLGHLSRRQAVAKDLRRQMLGTVHATLRGRRCKHTTPPFPAPPFPQTSHSGDHFEPCLPHPSPPLQREIQPPQPPQHDHNPHKRPPPRPPPGPSLYRAPCNTHSYAPPQSCEAHLSGCLTRSQ
jgi:hypothetical protein